MVMVMVCHLGIYVSAGSIPFALDQATQCTSLEYPQGLFSREKFSTLFYTIPLLRGFVKYFTEVKKYFPMVLICQVTG